MQKPITHLAGIAGAAIAVFLTAALPGYVLVHFPHRLPRADPRLMVIAAQCVVLATIFLVLRVQVRTVGAPGSPVAGVKAVAWLILGTLTFSLLVTVSMVVTGSGGFQPGFEYSLGRMRADFPQTGLAGYFGLLVLIGPLFEELLFRVLIIGHLLSRSPPWLALIVSVLLFMLGHSSWLLSGLLGVAFGLVYLRFRSLWLCFAAHSAHNLISTGGVTLLIAYLHDRQYLMPTGDNILLVQLVWFAVVIACLALFLRYVFAGVEGGPLRLLFPRRSPVAEATPA